MQPVFFADITDLSLRSEEQAFLLGEKLLVVPRWAENPSLPDGNWRKIYLINESSENDGYQPELRLKAGSIIPLGRIIQSTASYSTDSITLLIAPDAQLMAAGYLYHDNGDGYGYQDGEYAITDFQATPTGDDSLLVTCLKSEGAWDNVNRIYQAGLVTNYGIFYSNWKTDSIFKIPFFPDLYIEVADPVNGIHIYPNPAQDNVTISLGNPEGGKIDIFPLTGILLKEIMIEKGRHTASVNVSGLSSGIYLVRIQTGDSTINRKLIIKR